MQEKLKKSKKQSKLTMHKLIGEHDWQFLPSTDSPFLMRCAVCHITRKELYGHTGIFMGDEYITGNNRGAVLTMSGIKAITTSDSTKPDLFITSAKTMKAYNKLITTS